MLSAYRYEDEGRRDSGRQKLAHVYFEGKPGRRSAANLLTRDEARRIAVNVATLW
jgi:hypothetical protein